MAETHGLVIDGEVAAGEAGRYPVTNRARPGELVLEALTAPVAARLQAGTVFVNAHGMSAMGPSAPMGGWKRSGLGLELGPEGLRALCRPRVVLAHPGPGVGAGTAAGVGA